jgi:hypothetical protein
MVLQRQRVVGLVMIADALGSDTIMRSVTARPARVSSNSGTPIAAPRKIADGHRAAPLRLRNNLGEFAACMVNSRLKFRLDQGNTLPGAWRAGPTFGRCNGCLNGAKRSCPVPKVVLVQPIHGLLRARDDIFAVRGLKVHLSHRSPLRKAPRTKGMKRA